MNSNAIGKRSLVVLAMFAALAILYIGCNSSSSGGAAVVNPEEYADVSGTWQISEEVNDSECWGDDHTSYDNYQLSVTQSGNSITVTDQQNNQFTGTVSGNSLSWSGSFQQDGGTLTITSMSLTITGNTITGTANWTWTNGIKTCSGSTRVNGIRTSSSDNVPFAGTWKLGYSEKQMTGPCDTEDMDLDEEVTIIVNGDKIIMLVTGSEPWTGTLTGNSAVFDIEEAENGETSTAEVNLTISPDGKTLTGDLTWHADFYDYVNDTEESCTFTAKVSGTRQ
jgi:hypothetical protein